MIPRHTSRSSDPATALPLVRLLGRLPVPVVALNPAREVIFWNPAAEETFGWTEAEVMGQTNPIVPESRREEFRDLHDRVLRGEELTGVPLRRITRGGRELEVVLWSRVLRDDRGRPAGSIAVLTEGSRESRDRRALRTAAEAALTQTFEALDQSVRTSLATHMAIVDEDGELTIVNDSWRRLGTEVTRGIAGHPVGANLREVCAELAREHGGTFDVIANRLPEVLDGEGAFQVEYPVPPRREDDPDRWHLFSAYPVETRAGVAAVAIIDITERKELEEELEWMAYRDPLTGLANRRLLREVARQSLEAARRYERNVGYLHFDLRRFKAINDTLGHPVGDEVLVGVADRLRRHYRHADVVARPGGDEFVVVLTEVVDEEAIRAAAERGCEALGSDPLVVDGASVDVDPRAGAAISVGGQVEFVELQRQADIALREAKLKGSSVVRLYRPELARYSSEQLELERELREAIEDGELRLHYQPVVRAGTEEVVGMEALVRWPHPDRGLIGAGTVVSLAEEIGVIQDLDRWVFRQAVSRLGAWAERGWSGWVSVNLDARTLPDPKLTELISELFGEIDPSFPERIIVEVTEHGAMRDPQASAERLSRLHEFGLRIALDDFGTGYSSLAYLRRFPVDVLKVDQSFVHEIGEKRTDERLMRAVVGIGASLDVWVVAEGVETRRQQRWLETIGCDLLQGYLFGRPAAAEAFDLDRATSG